jgi:cytochrome c556
MFPPGGDPEKTRATAAVWSNPEGFKAHAEKLVTTGQALAAAGKSGDRAAIEAAANAVDETCDACHKDFSTFKRK